MRRVILQPGETFSNAHLKRTGAFNAQRWPRQPTSSRTCARGATPRCASTPSASTV